MVKKIFFVIFMIIMTYFTSFVVIYNETLKSVESIISDAIVNDDYHSILAYNDYYMDTPQYFSKTSDNSVSVFNTYDEGEQTITLIIVDRNKVQGEQSQLKVTCTEEHTVSNIFTEYEDGSIAVITLYQDGEETISLEGDCLNENFENLLVTLNNGEILADVDNTIGFINEDDIVNNGVEGYTANEVEQIQYPNGLIKPLILPILSLWVIVFGLIYVYKKVLKKKNIN